MAGSNHRYIIGKSGTGKSTYLQNLILDTEGGFALLDPHGDLAESVADNIDCIYFDPILSPIGFNVLENVPIPQRHLVASNVVSSFKAIWADSWGPRLEWICYNALRLLLDNNKTLLDIPAVLTDPTFRRRCLARSTYPDFWVNEFETWDARYRNEAIAPVLNKVGQLAADPTLRRILGGKSSLKPERIMNKGQRLVVNLSKGKMGDIPSHLLGALLVSAFAQAADRRSTIPEEDRVPFWLFADEFQNFATDQFATTLSESRKVKLFLTLSHQYIGQLPDALRDAVFGNVASMTVFRVGAQDAPLLAQELGIRLPEDSVDQLSGLDDHYAYTKNTTTYDPRPVKTPPPRPRLGKLKGNLKHTRACYLRPGSAGY